MADASRAFYGQALGPGPPGTIYGQAMGPDIPMRDFVGEGTELDAKELKLPLPKSMRPKQPGRLLDLLTITVLPWLIFLLIVCCFLLLSQNQQVLSWLLVSVCVALGLGFLVAGWLMRHSSFIALGFLCLTSAIISTGFGIWLNAQFLSKYYFLTDGGEYHNISPLSNSSTAVGAGVIYFTLDSFVDDHRTIGYVAQNNIFCVAPVAAQGHPWARVEYWAVGEGCCEQRSNFDCGVARDMNSLMAVTAEPDPVFNAAIEEAKGVYNLTTSSSPSFVSFVSDPQTYIADMWQQAITVAAVAIIMDMASSVIAGMVIAKFLFLPERMPTMTDKKL